MKSPVVLVTAALTVAILLAASFLIATGTRGEDAGESPTVNPPRLAQPMSPAAK